MFVDYPMNVVGEWDTMVADNIPVDGVTVEEPKNDKLGNLKASTPEHCRRSV